MALNAAASTYQGGSFSTGCSSRGRGGPLRLLRVSANLRGWECLFAVLLPAAGRGHFLAPCNRFGGLPVPILSPLALAAFPYPADRRRRRRAGLREFFLPRYAKNNSSGAPLGRGRLDFFRGFHAAKHQKENNVVDEL